MRPNIDGLSEFEFCEYLDWFVEQISPFLGDPEEGVIVSAEKIIRDYEKERDV